MDTHFAHFALAVTDIIADRRHYRNSEKPLACGRESAVSVLLIPVRHLGPIHNGGSPNGAGIAQLQLKCGVRRRCLR